MRTSARSGWRRKPKPLLNRPAISGIRGDKMASRDDLAAIAINDVALPSDGGALVGQPRSTLAAATRTLALALEEGEIIGAIAPPFSISWPAVLSASSLGRAGALAASG